MMISPEEYYETELKERTQRELLSRILQLQQQMIYLKNCMENPYHKRELVLPDEATQLAMTREYLAVAKKEYAVPEEPQPAPQAEESALSLQTVTVHIPLLKRGATGIPVESAQAVLIHRGYDCGGRKFLGRETPDGDFGPATEKAVRNFQTKTALEPDGEIGADTWAALISA